MSSVFAPCYTARKNTEHSFLRSEWKNTSLSVVPTAEFEVRGEIYAGE